jgi:beta-lactamase superfamily II metal-dependent hydrolase
VLAELDGKRMLLTGDARGDKILKGLQAVGLLASGSNSKLEIDLLKVPHHGSANNLDNDFFERIIAKHYVFSGNGEHGNPEREALQMLLNARGDDDYTVHLTYPVSEIDAERKNDWQIQQNREKKRKTNKPDTKVRPNWSPEKHSLTALIAAHGDFAERIRIVKAGKPHVIDLLDEVGF